MHWSIPLHKFKKKYTFSKQFWVNFRARYAREEQPQLAGLSTSFSFLDKVNSKSDAMNNRRKITVIVQENII